MIKKITSIIQKHGILKLFQVLLSRLYIKKSRYYLRVKEIVSKGHGLEIGGKSFIFDKKGILPVYKQIKHLDNCNFSSRTVWEGKIKKGLSYYYDTVHKPGRQFVLEATYLREIKDEAYDFILSSHVLEHIANPIKALDEWKRIIKPKGYLLLVLPHKEGTFDHNRPTTTLKHLLDDFDNDVDETDLTHLEEILALHDLTRDPEAGDLQSFHARSKQNYENRCLHHHVFDTALAIDLLNHLKFKIDIVEVLEPMHIVILAQKIEPELFSASSPSYISPFSADKGSSKI